MTTAITVTIGRNVGTEPMSADEWNNYVASTREAVESATSELWAKSPYRGGWDGVAEDAFLFYGPALSAAAVEVLRHRLAVLATYYGQDAIGLTVGEAGLVENLDRSERPLVSPASAELR